MENETILNETEMNDAEKKKSGLRADFEERYQSAQTACKSTLERLARDLRESNGNPYIRSTSTFRYDIFRTANDTDPIDTFVFEKTNGCSLRALILAASLLAAANIAIKSHFGK